MVALKWTSLVSGVPFAVKAGPISRQTQHVNNSNLLVGSLTLQRWNKAIIPQCFLEVSTVPIRVLSLLTARIKALEKISAASLCQQPSRLEKLLEFYAIKMKVHKIKFWFALQVYLNRSPRPKVMLNTVTGQ